ncbi:uncharacterized protein [Heptranchias perlo]|uniref:uncharacterized protein n=1 Tax=Heptranchias perlo TaxID=212740 RepID=UPI00355A49E4
MWTLWFSLLFLLWAPTSDGAELNTDVLSLIVSDFRPEAVTEDENGRPTDRQFAFLMALTPTECRNRNVFGGYFPPGIRGTVTPSIKYNTANSLNHPRLNYMAVFPHTGEQCSEYKLLYLTDDDRNLGINTIAAQSFQNKLHARKMTVGCVIFYTRNTPCIRNCFSGNQNCEIVSPLSGSPFNTAWGNQNIGKYFVFSEVFRRDNNPESIRIIREKLQQIKGAGFIIRRCDGNQIQCQDCNAPDYCV